MKGLFIPGITAEMFRNGCLESIESLMAEGEIYDIDYKPALQWVPYSERSPSDDTDIILLIREKIGGVEKYFYVFGGFSDWLDTLYKLQYECEVVAWMPMPKPYEVDE